MAWQANPYSLPLFLSTAVAVVVGFIAWRRRPAPGAKAMVVLLSGLAVWCGAYGAYWGLSHNQAQLTALGLVTLGAALTPPAFLVFMLDVTDRRRWLTRPFVGVLGLMFLVTLACSWTNAWHQLWHTRVEFQVSGGLQIVHTENGPLYWIFAVVYAYGLMLTGTALLVAAFWHARGVYRRQYGLLLLAVGVALGPSVLFEAGLTPWPDLDLAPLGLAISGPLLAYALFFYKLLDLVPVARTLLVDSMLDAVIVLDQQDRIVDMNPAALHLSGWAGTSPLGQPARLVLAARPDLVARAPEDWETNTQIQLDPTHTLLLSIMPLRSPGGELGGRLIVLRDITALIQTQHELQSAHTQLLGQMAQIENLQLDLREQAIRDTLTGLYNRRFLAETMPREIARAGREGKPLSVIFVDLDHFKAVNDTYGHPAGDVVLQTVGQHLQRSARATDVVCRYGGEEMLILCPAMALVSAEERADEWRQGIARLTIATSEAVIHVTISVGLAAFPLHGDSMAAIIRAADGALYAAKTAGRNCVRTAASPPAA